MTVKLAGALGTLSASPGLWSAFFCVPSGAKSLKGTPGSLNAVQVWLPRETRPAEPGNQALLYQVTAVSKEGKTQAAQLWKPQLN